MNNLSIKTKLNIIVLATVIIVSTILAIQSILTIKSVSSEDIEKYKTEAYKTKEAELENYVSIAIKTVESYHQRTEPAKIKNEVSQDLQDRVNQIFSTIEYQYKKYKGKISDKQLKARIKDIISATRYGKSGYYWINDLNAVIIDHPIKPKLNGKDLSNFKDKGGKKIFTEFAQVCKEKNEGFVDYVWPKPGYDTPQPKVSFVKLFKPFGWVIGTGAYIDDVSDNLKKDAINAIKTMKYGKSGYFWINDMKPNMIMHPTKPSLDGKDLSGVKDPNGVYLFNEMVTVSQTNGGGLVKYSWPKPGKDTPQLKFSYVKPFNQWNWIIGTGAYVDDIEDKVKEMEKHTNEKINTTILSFVVSSVVVILLLMFIVTYLINKSIIKPLENFEHGIDSFFKFLRRETTQIELLDSSTNDELGHMAKIVNKSINDSKQDIENNHIFIDDVQTVMNRVEKGCFSLHIQRETNDPHLQQLKETINNGLIHLKEKFVAMNNILEEYSKHNYTNELNIDGIEKDGAFDKLVQNVNTLRSSINEMLVDNKSNGLALDSSSDILLQNVNTLNRNSNSAATSLEETAAALEQVTSNISQNTDNIVKMASHANDVTNSVNEGEKLASQTTSSMDEINNEVKAINEAIAVIDQISFQTNILSLNAAVEAATAGEAGKGFAVVAGEVRNLASRSAEAANEIKALVESATNKANSGKNIADDMIEGYHHLNESISKTLELIQSVENASKEQLHGIEQINSAVNSLDKQTQENASIASQTNEVAIQTDSIAKMVLKSADEKEFIGKDNVVAKVTQDNSVSPVIDETPKTIQETTDTKKDDDWASF